MTAVDKDALEQVVRRASKGKYKDVCPALVRRIATRELAIRERPKPATKSTRRKLHQVGAAYWRGSEPDDGRYVNWLQALREAGPAERAPVCRDIMASHASTAERLPLLETFYHQSLASIAPVATVLDLGCGLNPLAAPWMPLADDTHYHAYDIYGRMMAFLGQALPLLGLQAHVGCDDALAEPPTDKADVAMLLKVLPLVEQLWGDPAELIQRIQAPHLLISFPVASLGGRQRGMRQHYAERFEAMAETQGWSFETHLFETELAYLLHKGS